MGFPAARTPGPCILRLSGTAAVSEQWVHLSLEMPQLLLLQLFPQAVSEGLQGSQQRAWASPCLCSFWFPRHEPFFSSLLHSLPPLQPLRSREWVGDAGGGKAFLQHWRWVKPAPAGPVWVLCMGRRRGTPLIPKLSRVSPPLTGLMLLFLAHSPHRSWTSRIPSPANLSHPHHGRPVPGSHWSLSATLPSPEVPLPTFPRRRVPPQSQHGLNVGCWGEIFERATRSTTSTPRKPWAKSEHCSHQQCSGDRAKLHPGWALLSSLPIPARSTLHFCSQLQVVCVSDGEN